MAIAQRFINITVFIIFLVGCSSTNSTINQTPIPSQFPRICEGYYAPPNFSPNGHWMAELCYNENDKDLILTISNKETDALWKLLYQDYIPEMEFVPDGGMSVAYWSDDGRYAYFNSYSSGDGGGCFVPNSYGGWGLFRLELETGNAISILPIGEDEFTWYGFSFSPTHKYLVYGVNAKNFVILDMKTDKAFDITHQNDFDDGGGVIWSTDESEFVYSTGTWTSESENYSLRLVDAKTGNEKILLESKDSCFLAKEWKDEYIVLIEQIEPYDQKTVLEYDLKTNAVSTLVP
jgi:hypothetical protein